MNFFKKLLCRHKDSIWIDSYSNLEIKESSHHRRILRQCKNFKDKNSNLIVSPLVEKHKCKSCAATFLVYRIGFGYSIDKMID